MSTTKPKIALFYNARPIYGGWVTFTVYLYRSLIACGAQPYLFKIGPTSEKPRHFMDGINYQNISSEDASQLPSSMSKFIVAIDKHHMEATDPLLAQGAHIVIQGTIETRIQELVDSMRKHSTEPISIRPSIVENLKTLDIRSKYIKHPYLLKNEIIPAKTKNAVATSRVDFNKYTEIICEANEKLEDKVRIWGALNGMYHFVTLGKKFPDWKKNYFGQFRHDKVWRIINPAKYMVDLTAIVSDGGGSQYTFLEGWDAGCVLVLNKKWGLSGDKTMNPNVNCLFVEDADELCEVLQSNEDRSHLIEAGREKVKEYDGNVVGHEYIDYLCS